MLIATYATAIPWHKIWFPVNAGTLPAHWILGCWILCALAYSFRPTMRSRLFGLLILLLVGFLGAALWSMVDGFLRFADMAYRIGSEGSIPGSRQAGFNTGMWVFYISKAVRQTGGILILFAGMTLSSGLLILIWNPFKVAMFQFASKNQETEQDAPSNGG